MEYTPVEFEILETDIMNGQSQSCYTCPAALAIGRKKLWDFVQVLANRTRVDAPNHEIWEIPHPPELTKWIGDFDFGRTVLPMKFTLDVPRELMPA